MAKPPALPTLKALDSRAPKAPPVPERKAVAERPDNPHYRPSRDGLENITGYDLASVKLQLQEICMQRKRDTGRRTTIQDLMDEAFNDLFAKSGKPEIAGQPRKLAQNRKDGQG